MRDNHAEDTRKRHEGVNVKQPQGKTKMGKSADGGLFESGYFMLMGPFYLFPHCSLVVVVVSLSFRSTFICSLCAVVPRRHLSPFSVPCNAADGLCERCGRSQRISIYLTLTRPSSFPRSLMQHMQESLFPRPLLLVFGRPWSPLVSRCSCRHYCEPLFGTSC